MVTYTEGSGVQERLLLRAINKRLVNHTLSLSTSIILDILADFSESLLKIHNFRVVFLK